MLISVRRFQVLGNRPEKKQHRASIPLLPGDLCALHGPGRYPAGAVWPPVAYAAADPIDGPAEQGGIARTAARLQCQVDRSIALFPGLVIY